MSVATSAARFRPIASPLSRPVIDAPSLTVVPSPAPRKGFVTTVVLCIVMFASALFLAFYLNTRMVEGAYLIKDIKLELSAVQMHEESLEASAIGATSPEALRSKAQGLGMVPAGALREVNINTGTLSVPVE